MIDYFRKTSAVFILLFLVGCSSGEPSDTAEKFMTHLANGELNEASEYATENTMGLIAMASAFGKLPVDPDFEFHLIKESTDGNTAVVTYKKKSDGKEETIDLVKVDDKWKVHAQKK